MILNTKHFGEIEIDDQKIIEFKEGIPGFENIKKYTIITNPEKEVPFHWLQAIDEPELTFVITNPFLFKNDYEFHIPDKVIEELNIEKEEDLMIFTIVVIPDDMSKITMNTRAPLVINMKKKSGKQLLLDDEKYPLKYYLLEEEGAC
ncbi:flagellar assembly protein FliW [Inediibacterium massiliense]|uniref:flagellar assembly protein FliW n=1 Tax=Inediibacterium massiliense TaxID=1658111 RepID=UPI0006B4C41B|nr:flagellar assembly protein FliW [Inediibacterium massiliense]